jgi:hypothetical protein
MPQEKVCFISSEVEHTLGSFSQGVIFTSATATITGKKFSGDILKYWGTEITPASGSSKSFIIDFHGQRSISGVWVGGLGNKKIVELKQWLGVQFSPTPVVVEPGSFKSFPDILTQKLMIELDGKVNAQAFIDNCHVTCTSYPSNLKMSVGDGAPFWSYAGELTTQVDIPDFATQLNDFVKNCSSFPCKLQLLVHSDTPGEIEISKDLQVNYRTPVKLEGDLERIDFARDEQCDVAVELLDQGIGVGQVVNLSLDFQGEFDSSRIGESFDDVKEIIGAKVSSLFSVAQRITLRCSVNAQRFALYLNKVSSEVEAYLEIRGGTEDNPEDNPVISSAQADLKRVTKACWVDFTFSSPVGLNAESYWVVLKAKGGEAIWYADSCQDTDCLHYSRDGGMSWEKYVTGAGDTRGFFKLYYVPEPPTVVPPVSITVLKGETTVLKGDEKRVTPVDEPQPLMLEVGSTRGAGGLALRLKSETSGWLGLSNIIIEYTPLGQPRREKWEELISMTE